MQFNVALFHSLSLYCIPDAYEFTLLFLLVFVFALVKSLYLFQVGPLASIAGVVSSMAVLLIMIHWKQLKRPHLALMKIIFLAMCIFAIGTLPWQQHILGLMGGIVCGVVLTITMVPFLSITKYERKSKVILKCIACKDQNTK